MVTFEGEYCIMSRLPSSSGSNYGSPMGESFVVHGDPGNAVSSQPQQKPSVSPPKPSNPKGPSKGFKKLLPLLVLISLVLVGLALIFGVVLPRLGVFGSKDTEITWWGFWSDESVVTPLIAEYEAQNPNVKIKYISQSKTQYRERLTSAMARGTAPDIFKIHNSWTPMFFQEMAIAPASIISQSEFEDVFYRVMLEDLTTTKGVLAIPLQFDALGLFVNQDILTTFGKSVPETWSELTETALDLTIKDVNGVIRQSGVAMGTTNNVDHWEEIVGLLMYQNKANLLDPQDSGSAGALDFFVKFKTEYEIWDETQPNSTVAFANGKAVMYLGPSWRAHEIRETNPRIKFRVYPVPQLPKVSTADPNVTYATYWAEGVWAKSKAKAQSWEFLKWLSSSDNLQKLHANQAKSGKVYEEIYPRQDMRNLLLDDPLVGGIVELAPDARSWYFASHTSDGSTGINSQLSNVYQEFLSGAGTFRSSQTLEAKLPDLSIQVQLVLSKYGLVRAPVIEEL